MTVSRIFREKLSAMPTIKSGKNKNIENYCVFLATLINPAVIQVLGSTLEDLNGSLLKITLELFKSQQIEEETVAFEISKLLKNENRYISAMAFKYLESLDSLDKKTKKNVEKYKKKMD